MGALLSTSLQPQRRRRWPMVLLGIAIFISGLVGGIGLTIVFAVQGLQHILHHPEEGPANITRILTRKLELNDQQHQQVLAIVTHRVGEIQNIRKQFRPQIDGQLDLLRNEVDEVLNDHQRIQWEQLIDGLRKRWSPEFPANSSTSPAS